MIYAQEYIENGVLDQTAIHQTLSEGLGSRFTGAKVLVLIPDHTRSLPLPSLFSKVVDILQDTEQLDFMVALGTHPPLSEDQLNKLVGITSVERTTTYKHVGFFNHAWDNPDMLISLGVMAQDEIKQIAGSSWHESLPSEIDIRINKLVLEYDHILILGPTFPHEVVGFSGGAKYLFPGISGPDMINTTHWLGALATVVGTIGIKQTPVREMIHAAARRLTTPVTLAALIVEGHELAGIVIGDLFEAWNAVANLSALRHIQWVDRPFMRVLSWAPPMYNELWTAAKATYKVEPVVALGGEVIIYAPHLESVSNVHGKYIYAIGYHTLPYILHNWKKLKHIPLGVLAHSTHVRGSGEMVKGIEKPNIRVTLASQISEADCIQLNLNYLDPAMINVNDWKDRESDGILYVENGGEIPYRLKNNN